LATGDPPRNPGLPTLSRPAFVASTRPVPAWNVQYRARGSTRRQALTACSPHVGSCSSREQKVHRQSVTPSRSRVNPPSVCRRGSRGHPYGQRRLPRAARPTAHRVESGGPLGISPRRPPEQLAVTSRVVNPSGPADAGIESLPSPSGRLFLPGLRRPRPFPLVVGESGMPGSATSQLATLHALRPLLAQWGRESSPEVCTAGRGAWS
jgi:hypothetical protein